MKIMWIYLAIAAMFFMTACIKENTGDCFPDSAARIGFVYHGDGSKDIFAEKFSSVDLFVFNQNGDLINKYNFDKSYLAKQHSANIVLEQGHYKIIGWGNVNNFTVPAGYTFHDYMIVNKDALNGLRVTSGDPLYYGYKEIIINKNQTTNELISFSSSHINIEVTVDGVSTIPKELYGENNYPKVVFKRILPDYDFNMSLVGERADFDPLFSRKENLMKAEFKVPRFELDQRKNLIVEVHYPNGDLAGEFDLIKFCMVNSLNIKGVQELTIPIFIRFNKGEVKIWIEDWHTSELKPIL